MSSNGKNVTYLIILYFRITLVNL